MNKRGDEPLLLKQIVEIILAVIVIVIIVIAAQRFIGTYFGKQKDLQAKGTLDEIVKKLDALEIGQRDSYVLQAPVGWFIVSFDANNNQNNGFVKDTTYFQQNAICICEKSRDWLVIEKKACGVCRATKLPLKQGNILAFMEIKIADIWFSNEKDYYNLSEKTTVAQYQMTDREKEETTTKSQQITSNGYDKTVCEASAKYYPSVNQYVANEQEFRALVKAIMLQESTGDYAAISPGCGAVGLMQIMPKTAQEVNMKVYGLNINDKCIYTASSGCDSTYASCMIQLKQGKTQQELIALDDRFDASKSIVGSVEYLTKLINQLKSLELGIAAYNGGAGGVQAKCSFKNNILTCTGFERKPTPDQYASQVMARKQLIQQTGVTC